MKTKYTDFSKAVILADKNACAAEQKAVLVLAEEIFKRTGLKLSIETRYPHSAQAVIAVGRNWLPCIPAIALVSDLPKPGGEGYRLAIGNMGKPFCAIIGEDERGVLYGVGKLLRIKDWGDGKFMLPLDFSISTAPRFPIRGHQLAYRPKTNAYDAWTPEIFEQYIRELALFGANNIDILPPGTDDASKNDLMKFDSFEMMCILSDIIHSYGLEVGIWFPNMFAEDVDEKTLTEESAWRDKVFSNIPYLDNLFIPGGDPGRLFPKKLFEVSERFTAIAKKYHKDVKLWISPQTFCPSEQWAEEFYAELAKKPEWLHGVTFAPWVRDNIDMLRKRTPKRYPIRNYADICHTLRCQYPMPKWDLTLAMTLGREFINPRPNDEKHIHNLYCKYMVGSVCYSEGINDDANKFVWLDQEWNPKTPVIDTLTDYARLFIDCEKAEELADGLMALEKNLIGEFAVNPEIEKTYEKWTDIEKRLGETAKTNYRFEMHLLRACFDYYQKNRYLYEKSLETEALEALSAGAENCIKNAKLILNKAKTEKILPEISEKINKLADLLFENIGAQLTVTRHFASEWDRGAFVECLDIPLNDRRYVLVQLDKAETLKNEKERQAAILGIVSRTDPGKGGFYDNFGSKESWKRLENHDNYPNDPSFFKTPLLSFLMPPPHDTDDKLNVPLAWRQNVYTLYQTPLFVNYEGLDKNADYIIKTVYGKYHPVHIKLCAGLDGEVLIHDEIFVNEPFVEAENPLPKAAYQNGKLRLKFTVRDGERGPNISEIFIRRVVNG